MSWLNTKTNTVYYGLEYMHPEEDDYILTKDYCFTAYGTYGEQVLDIFGDILVNLKPSCLELSWSSADVYDGEDYMARILFTCFEKTQIKISYLLDAYTDGWGYSMEEIK